MSSRQRIRKPGLQAPVNRKLHSSRRPVIAANTLRRTVLAEKLFGMK